MCLKLFYAFQIRIKVSNFGKPLVLFNDQTLICCTDLLAPIEAESLLKAKPIFFLARKSDFRIPIGIGTKGYKLM
jgi:hypothetical protein